MQEKLENAIYFLPRNLKKTNRQKKKEHIGKIIYIKKETKNQRFVSGEGYFFNRGNLNDTSGSE